MLFIGNGTVVTRDPVQPFIVQGAVLLDGDKILAVGEETALRQKYPTAEYLDAGGGILMPGLINAHQHIYSAFARGLSIRGSKPQNFLDILRGTWWRLDRALGLADVYESARVTYLECIQNGVTTVFDHHASYGAVTGSLSAIAQAAGELGVRSCLCYEVSDRAGKAKMRAAVRENTAFMQYCAAAGDARLRGMMGMHASFTLSDETLDFCRQEMPTGAGCHIHVAEGLADVQQTLEKHAKRIVQRLYDFDLLGPQTIAAHCIHINPAEMELLRETDTMVVHNPESNMGNAVGCPPALTMEQQGILVGLGTDGYTNDMLESYKAANLLHKHSLCNPCAAWDEVPRMLFVHNAALAGRYFAMPIGILRAGAAADLIVLDYHPYTPLTAENIDAHILFGMSGRDVVTTIVAGKVLMKDRQMWVDAAAIRAKAQEQAAGLWRRINA